MKNKVFLVSLLLALGYAKYADRLENPFQKNTREPTPGQLDWAALGLADPAQLGAPNRDPKTINQSVWKVDALAGSGSAFVIHPDGYLLTNRHVAVSALAEEELILKSIYGSTELRARLVSLNVCDDLALLKVENLDGVRLPYLALSDSPLNSQASSIVTAYGFPQGKYRFQSGLIEENPEAKITEYFGVDHWFNTTAFLGPGSSGGPILNEDAEVVGVSVTADTRGRDQQGIDLYANLSDLQRMFSESFTNGYGVTYRFLETGALEVAEVQAEGLGREFGLRSGDQVIGINNRPIQPQIAQGQLCNNLQAETPSLRVLREGRPIDLTLQPRTETEAETTEEFLFPVR